MPEKRLTLNSEKRKAIADVFQNHFEQTSPKYELHKKSIADYNEARTKMKVLAETVVRHHQPQEDVDTIKSMIVNMGEVVESYMMITALSLLHHQEWKQIVMEVKEKSLMKAMLSLI